MKLPANIISLLWGKLFTIDGLFFLSSILFLIRTWACKLCVPCIKKSIFTLSILLSWCLMEGHFFFFFIAVLISCWHKILLYCVSILILVLLYFILHKWKTSTSYIPALICLSKKYIYIYCFDIDFDKCKRKLFQVIAFTAS